MGTLCLKKAMAAAATLLPQVQSAGGILALLNEDDDTLKKYALEKLDMIVDDFWPQISQQLDQILMMQEDSGFGSQQLAALLASKVFYHLGEITEALNYALLAGTLFDVNAAGKYVQTLVATCISEYIRQRKEGDADVNAALVAVVERMFERCLVDGQFEQAVGVAIESKRLDKVEEAISRAADSRALLDYTFDACQKVIQDLEFRREVLHLIVRLHTQTSGQEGPKDYTAICQCYLLLDNPLEVFHILDALIKPAGLEGSAPATSVSSAEANRNVLTAYQVAFQLAESEQQNFLATVRNMLPSPAAPAAAAPAPSGNSDAPANDAGTAPAAGGESMDVDNASSPPAAPEGADQPVDTSPAGIYAARVANLQSLLSGDSVANYQLQFLKKANQADLLILNNLKKAVDPRNSVLHAGTIVANALMHCGTTSDVFLRDNLEWLAKATNWAKFTSVASMGVIHRGHTKEGKNIMSQYLPQDNGQPTQGGPYAEGGALYALGIINAARGSEIGRYLSDRIKGAGNNEVLQHGACLGLGLAAMATSNEQYYTDVKDVMYQDSAVAGEAAGLAMGMIKLGSADSAAVEEMLQYAHDTQHEKIIRGISMGVAMIMYGRESAADALISQLSMDKDPLMRYSAMFTIALAYAGTGDNRAIKRLLHSAVSDVSDDVQRAAVMGLGFVLLNNPSQCPKIVNLLSESFNPYVRYGSCMAVGISCAGTGLKEAYDLLEPMASDPVDFVRQGALLALSMVMIQQTEKSNPKVKDLRTLLSKVVSDKHEELLARLGAILAHGILDAGGRNMTISLVSSGGHKRMSAIVGMALFTQFWWWYPCMHFISLCFTPTAIFGLNVDMKMPKFTFKSNARPSQFAYPPKLTAEKKKQAEKVEKAKLSTAARGKGSKKDKAGAPSSPVAAGSSKADGDNAQDRKDGDSKDKKDDDTTTAAEADFEILNNPSRVLSQQLPLISFDVDPRYQPVRDVSRLGIVFLDDNEPDKEAEFVPTVTLYAGAGGATDEEDEPEPPEPFEYIEDTA